VGKDIKHPEVSLASIADDLSALTLATERVANHLRDIGRVLEKLVDIHEASGDALRGIERGVLK